MKSAAFQVDGGDESRKPAQQSADAHIGAAISQVPKLADVRIRAPT